MSDLDSVGKQSALVEINSGKGIEGTLVVEAAHETVALVQQLEEILFQQGIERMEVVVLCFDYESEAVEAAISARFPTLRVIALPAESPTEHAERVLREVRTDKLAFLPFGNLPCAPRFSLLPDDEHSLSILLPATDFEQKQGFGSNGWIVSRELLKQLPSLRFPVDWNLVALEALLRENQCTVTWPSLRSTSPEVGVVQPADRAPVLTLESSVLALIPHYRCEEWLECCLKSIVAQTRPLEGIVVIDDGSDVPPVEVVEKFPQVTLLTSTETVGPYCLKQQVINSTNYDAYLLQDADDWSSSSRLKLLLTEAQRTGADIVGSQEIEFDCDREEIVPIAYPANVNATLVQDKSCDPLLHPACLISRQILSRLNGFATGLRFAGDAEFLLRARFAALMVNTPYYCYFRRKRAGSLNTTPETGIPTPMTEPIQLIHLTGPELRWR